MASIRKGAYAGAMKIGGKTWGAVFSLACALAAGQPPAAPPAGEGGGRPLTLGTPMLRSTLERMNLAWGVPERIPDFRLKLERPALGPLSPAEMERQLRGVEIRLPMEGVWVGYEKASEGEEPRATFSIQRSF